MFSLLFCTEISESKIFFSALLTQESLCDTFSEYSTNLEARDTASISLYSIISL